MPTQRFEYRKILESLSDHKVNYLLIGGVCAVAHGAPVTTFDVDILYEMTDENLDRIMATLDTLDAYHREPGNRRLPPNRRALKLGGPCLFSTIFGSLDMLGILAGERHYKDLLPHSIQLTLKDNLIIKMLDLPTLIEVKQDTGRAKDIAVLPLLESTLKARSAQMPDASDE